MPQYLSLEYASLRVASLWRIHLSSDRYLMVLVKLSVKYFNVVGGISLANTSVLSSVVNLVSLFLTNTSLVIDDISLAGMIILRSVFDDIGILVTVTLVAIDDDSLVGTSSTSCASHDICFNDIGKMPEFPTVFQRQQRILEGISLAVSAQTILRCLVHLSGGRGHYERCAK